MSEFFTLTLIFASPGIQSRRLIWVGFVCTSFGFYLLKKAWDNDLLLPGTLTVYIPKWIFVFSGLLFQTPLPLAWWFLKSQG